MENFFEWDPVKYSLDIEAMDEEHQDIIDCMNHLYALHTQQAGRSQLQQTLDELVRVTQNHFADEEAYMRKIGYPELLKHSIVHKHLLERLEKFSGQLKAQGKLPDDLFPFLKMWLKSHIGGIDVKYAAHSRAA
jgi:hemerythrin-like metal-binding protein